MKTDTQIERMLDETAEINNAFVEVLELTPSSSADELMMATIIGSFRAGIMWTISREDIGVTKIVEKVNEIMRDIRASQN